MAGIDTRERFSRSRGTVRLIWAVLVLVALAGAGPNGGLLAQESYDYGDLPDGPYPTLQASNGARHLIGSGDFILGPTRDAEADGQPDFSALGDDLLASDDEDGIDFGAPFVAGTTVPATVTLGGAGSGTPYFNAWADFNDDGDLNDPGEHFVSDQLLASTSGVPQSFSIAVPNDLQPGQVLYMRFRLSSDQGLGINGTAQDGEVEDYAVAIVSGIDYGDAPDSYGTTTSNDGAGHGFSSGLYLGSTVDIEGDGQPTTDANGDDLNGDDEDALSGPLGELACTEDATLEIPYNNTLGKAYLDAWIDFNGNGIFDEGEQIANSIQLSNGPGTYTIVYDIPCDAVPGDSYLRIRISTDEDLGPTGLTDVGEVEDYVYTITALDFGDLPDGPYPTLVSSDGARHVIVEGGPVLGATVDPESNGQPNPTATGDDTDVLGDDEDGVTLPAVFRPGETAEITITGTEGALLDAWIDFDGDGVLEAGEQIAVSVPIPTGGVLTLSVPLGTSTTEFVSGDTYARFRLSSSGGLAPNGLAADGEVEDYAVLIFRASIDIEKTPDTQQVDNEGTASFTLTVTNTGDVDLTNVLVNDPQCTTLTPETNGNGDAVLSPSEVWTYTCDIAGVTADFENTASVTGTDPVGGPVSDSDIASVDVRPAIQVDKAPSVSVVAEPGGPVTFTVTVTNLHGDPLTLTSLSDDVYGDVTTTAGAITSTTCTLPQNLAPNGQVGDTYTCAFTAPVAGNAGFVHENTVTGTAEDGEGNQATDDGLASVTITDVQPDITVVKTAEPTEVQEPSGEVTYTVTVTNNSTAEGVTITSLTDDKFGDLNGLGTCALPQPLAPSGQSGDSYTCTFTQTVSGDPQTPHVNVVTAVGQDDDGNTDTETDDATVSFTPVVPGMLVTKTADPAKVASGGSSTFTIEVENTGNAPLTNIQVIDDTCPLAPEYQSGDVSNPGVLDVGEVWVYTCTVAGITVDLTNTASATGTPPVGEPVGDDDQATVDVLPALTVTKSADPTTVQEPGGTVTYEVTVTNDVAESITLTSLTDDLFGDITQVQGAITATSCALVTVDPGLPYTCSFTAELTGLVGPSDHTNTVTATGEDNEGNPASDDDSATVTITTSEPAISLVKTTITPKIPIDGTAQFTIEVTNAGNADLDNVVVTDALCDATPNLVDDGDGDAILAVGETWVYTCARANVPADFVNEASVTADDPLDTQVGDSDTAPVDVLPEISVTKTPEPATLQEPGGSVVFTVVVTNLSNEPVTLTSLIDDVFGDVTVLAGDVTATTCSVPQALGAIASGTETYTCTFTANVTGTVTQPHVNTVTATAVDTDPNLPIPSPDQVEASDDATVTFTELAAALTVTKTASPTTIDIGGDVTFTVTVENTGNAPLTNVDVSDSQCTLDYDSGDAGEIGVMEVGEIWTYTCTVSGILADRTNTATATATDPGNNPVEDSDDAFVDVRPEISVTKTPEPSTLQEPGGSVVFTVVVTNLSNEPVTLTSLIDNVYGDVTAVAGDVTATTCSIPQPLTETGGGAPTYSCTFTANVTGTVQGGPHVNTITATASDDEQNPAQASGDATVTFTAVEPAIDVVKTTSTPQVAPGTNVVFTIAVSNPGNAPLSNIQVNDALCTVGPTYQSGDLNDNDVLEVGETWLYSCTVENVTADLINKVDVAGTPPVGEPVTDSDSEEVTVLYPQIGVAKFVSTPPVDNGNGTWTITYTLLVENTGNDDLTDVQVTEDFEVVFAETNSWSVADPVSADFAVNTNFDGLTAGDQDLLAPGQTLAIGASGIITIEVTIEPLYARQTFVNQVLATGQGTFDPTEDLSDNAQTVDENGDGDPTNDSDPTRVEINAGPLPIELVAFAAAPENASVVVSWQTAGETQAAGFSLEADFEEEGYEEVVWLDAAGNATEAQDYRYEMANARYGFYRFRLRMVDLDGAETFSEEIELLHALPEDFVLEAAYPNPFNPSASVRFAVRESEPVRIELYSALGQRVQTLYEGAPAAGVTQTVRIDASGLTSGTYYVRLIGASFTASRSVVLLK